MQKKVELIDPRQTTIEERIAAVKTDDPKMLGAEQKTDRCFGCGKPLLLPEKAIGVCSWCFQSRR